jgi:hypothetical protein
VPTPDQYWVFHPLWITRSVRMTVGDMEISIIATEYWEFQ